MLESASVRAGRLDVPADMPATCQSLQRRAVACFVVLFGWLNASQAQNFTPIALASASPGQALVNEAVSFSSAGTIDPDGGPQALSFVWDFGDGSGSSLASPQHGYTNAGAFNVSLTVSDGAATAVKTLVVHVLAPPTSAPPSRSAALALRPGADELWVVNPDAGSVSVIDLRVGIGAKVSELPVGPRPRTLAFNADGSRVFVACQDADALWVIDAATRTLQRRSPVGHEPYGVAVATGSGKILVSNQGDGTLSVLDPSLIVERVMPMGDSPRAIAVSADGNTAYVSHFITRSAAGAITSLDLVTWQTNAVINLVDDPGPDTTSSGRGVPNLLSALTMEPSGEHVWFGGLKSNSGRGMFLTGERLVAKNTVRGVFGKIATGSNSEVLARRIDTNDADSASDIAFSPDGRHAYVTHQGAETLSVYDVSRARLFAPGNGTTVPFEKRVEVGNAPQGVVVRADGLRAYVANFLSRDVSVISLSNPTDPVVMGTIAVTAESLSPSLANGKRLFYRSKGPVHSDGNYIACVSCHADGGGIDGRNWDFTDRGEGLRNTISLFGQGGTSNGPVHWSANFDEIQDFENDIVNAFGGTGLAQDGQGPNPPLGAPNAGRSQDLDDLAAYVASLNTPARSPFRQRDGGLSAAALRGKTIFADAAVGCANCHLPPRFTDSALTANPTNFVFHDVGTIRAGSGNRLGGTLSGFDTPSLRGLWRSAPYLHDGSAATLREVLTTLNPADQHGVTSQMTAAQLNDLEAYLLSLDGTTEDTPVDGDNDGIPDAWERAHGLNPADINDGSLDSDGDRLSNRDEFLAGTLPNEAASGLFIRGLGFRNQATEITFPSSKGIDYLVESRPSLGAGAWNLLASPVGDGAETLVTDTNAPSGQRFYRLRINPNP